MRKGVRKSRSFETLEDAQKWATEAELKILKLGVLEESVIEGKDLTRIYVKAKENAKARGIEFSINRDHVVMLFGKAGNRCQITGIPFNAFRPVGSTKRPWFPSLDRIDSSKGYTLDNCRMVCVAVNFAMGEWGEWVLRAIAEAIVLGAPGVLRNGTDAPPYKFNALGKNPTERQKIRRMMRGKPTANPQEKSLSASA
jgi:hypothetical protein